MGSRQIGRRAHAGVTASYFRLVDTLKATPVDETLSIALQNLEKSAPQLEAEQEVLLKEILDFARSNTAAYRRCIGDRGTDEFEDIPILEKSDLLVRPDEFASDKGLGRTFQGSTSGSTGTSLIFGYDSPHSAWAEACKLRGRSWFGVARHDPTLILWGRPLARSAFRQHFADPLKSALRNERHFNTFHRMDDEFLQRLVDCLKETRPAYVYGYGSSLACVARFLENRDLQLDNGPKLIHFTADHLGEMDRGALSRHLGARVASDYGASEAAGIAVECPSGFLHISIDCYKVEFLDENGTSVGPDTPGDIVVTALHNRAMPLIRYRIGDVGKPIDGACDCGNPMPRMKLLIGKSVDIIATSFADGVSAHYLDYINIDLMRNGRAGIRQFKIVQEDRDVFELQIVPGDGDTHDAASGFIEAFRKRVGPVEVRLQIVDDIPTARSGKHRYFESRLQER